MLPHSIWRWSHAALLTLMGLAACRSTPHSATLPNATHRLQQRTALYRGAPQQARAAERQLEADVYVRVIESAGSYCLVETEDGDAGWVLSSVLTPLVGS